LYTHPKNFFDSPLLPDERGDGVGNLQATAADRSSVSQVHDLCSLLNATSWPHFHRSDRTIVCRVFELENADSDNIWTRVL
jgi:hypothetical protein